MYWNAWRKREVLHQAMININMRCIEIKGKVAIL